MRNGSEGEFEIVLGNKQLLSVFFIVVVLLGVFFTMGYVVGRKSSESFAAQPVADRQPETVSAAAKPAPEPSLAEPSAAESPAVPSVDTSERPSPMPPADTPAAQTPETDPPVSGRFSNPQPGETYLQVAATKKSEAELMAEVLAKKGFTTTVMPAPNTELYRVLVGPLADAVAVDKTRTRLKEIGLDSILRKL
jgi:cell division protein FtsN